MKSGRLIGIGLMTLLLAQGLFFSEAAQPPDKINFQGVLRDDVGSPVSDGPHAMVFRFYDAAGGGSLLLTDSQVVTMTGGVFNAHLGSGAITPPGASLSEFLRSHEVVYLEVEVEGDTLLPRIEVVSSAYALNAGALGGRETSFFLDTSSAAQSKTGALTLDTQEAPALIVRSGGYSAARFEDNPDSGESDVLVVNGYADDSYGIVVDARSIAGIFANTAFGKGAVIGHRDFGSYFYGPGCDVYLAGSEETGTYGVEATGADAGGHFLDESQSGSAYVGYGNYGVYAEGSHDAGYFRADASGGYGIEGLGQAVGGYFRDLNSSGYAYVGYGDYGIQGYGTTMGGYFEDPDDNGYAYLGAQYTGVRGFGSSGGGFFRALTLSGDFDSGSANVGYSDYGIQASGDAAGGYFLDLDNGGYAHVGTGTQKISGSGSNGFVQNHPYDDEKVLVYNSPEGDEVATYTRGTARLIEGEVRVPLGETFGWVTNPDIGLTAHVTPRDASALYVESLTTEELVVRSLDGFDDDAVFDYLVYGLRIGFEEVSVVQEKRRDAYIPSMRDHRDRYARFPELRSFNALERFKRMQLALGDAVDFDLSASEGLRNAIVEFDPTIHDALGPEGEPLHLPDEIRVEVDDPRHDRESSAETPRTDLVQAKSDAVSVGWTAGPRADKVEDVDHKSCRPSVADAGSVVDVTEPVEAGDVLVIDGERPGWMKLAKAPADANVFGVVAADPGEFEIEIEDSDASPSAVSVRAAVSGVMWCKADAGYGVIRPGNLLTTSPTPGHAMLAYDVQPGTILGKALEPLEDGTGLIRVLVMLR